MPNPDSSASLIGFTSAPEVRAFNPADAVAKLTTRKALDMVRT